MDIILLTADMIKSDIMNIFKIEQEKLKIKFQVKYIYIYINSIKVLINI